MKFSIITATYNSAATVEDTIRSVASQDYPYKEHIIVDGGSTDGTLNIIEKHQAGISKTLSEKDNGIYDALNKGIGLATGDWIIFLHSDDVYVNSKVLSSYANLIARENCDAVYSDLLYVDRHDLSVIKRKWKSGNYTLRSFLYGWMPPHPTFAVKKEVFEKFGRFNLQLKTAADYELMLRFLYKHRIRAAYLPEFTVRMRTGGVSNSTVMNRVRANREDRRAWDINGLKPYFFTLWLKPARKILQFAG